MSITTYAELKTAVQNWLERPDLSALIPDFIRLAETMINRDLRCRQNEKRIYVSGGISEEFFDIPSNFLEMRNIEIEYRTDVDDPTTKTYVQKLDYMSPEVVDIFYPSYTTRIPEVYTIHGNEFQLKPAPDQNYVLNMTYWYKLTSFSSDSDSNSVLTNFPGVYLYGSLVSAAPYINDDEQLAKWIDMYNNEIITVNENDRKGRFSGTVLQARPDFEE